MARPRKHDGVLYRRAGSTSGGCDIAIGCSASRESTGTSDWKEAHQKTSSTTAGTRRQSLEIVRRGERLEFSEWAQAFLENYSKPPLRAPKTHEANCRGVKHLTRAFGSRNLGDLTADDIEDHLRHRLRERVQRRTKGGIIEKGVVRPATVHQEFRILRRILNVAVRKKLLPSNPCNGVEFPVAGRARSDRTT